VKFKNKWSQLLIFQTRPAAQPHLKDDAHKSLLRLIADCIRHLKKTDWNDLVASTINYK
jgi:hypothetical protein